MAAKKTAAKTPKTEETPVDAPVADSTLEVAAKSDTAVEPVAVKAGVQTYRTDLGESLPPQNPAGVE